MMSTYLILHRWEGGLGSWACYEVAQYPVAHILCVHMGIWVCDRAVEEAKQCDDADIECLRALSNLG